MEILSRKRTMNCIMSAKILNMEGQDITPAPPSFEEQFMMDVITFVNELGPEVATETIFRKYEIKLK